MVCILHPLASLSTSTYEVDRSKSSSEHRNTEEPSLRGPEFISCLVIGKLFSTTVDSRKIIASAPLSKRAECAPLGALDSGEASPSQAEESRF